MSNRKIEEIFDDLRHLCCEEGFLHAISSIIYRDFFLSVDVEGAVTLHRDDRYARGRLNNNELMLLCGLVVQSNNSDISRESADIEALVSRTDALLEELHAALAEPLWRVFSEGNPGQASFSDHAKEAIYYGAESAIHSEQYAKFARHRYRPDYLWLLQNKGISIRPICEIARFIEGCVNRQISALTYYCLETSCALDPGLISKALQVKKEAVRARFGERATRYFDLFSISVHGRKLSFSDPFAFNEVNARPILDFGDAVYVTNTLKLYESIYDSPYYWMLLDDNYKDVAAENRGRFLENAISEMLRQKFGEKNVFTNVVIRRSRKEIAAEADVLVVYGEFVLVIQAKSKRLTLAARSGDTGKIENDFRGAVQSAYEQAIRFCDLLHAGAKCEVGDKDVRSLRFVTRTFPIVVLSDHFPGLTMLTNQLLKIVDERPPAVIDIFFLDAMLEFLRHPVEVLYYFQQRTRFFTKVWTDSEINLLGFHMKEKLYIDSDLDLVHVDRSYATEIDDYFIAKGVGVSQERKGFAMEERIAIPRITELISCLKSGPSAVAGIAIDLLDFSNDALKNIVEGIDMVRAEVKAGKAFKSFSLETHFGGITYFATREYDRKAVEMAEGVARKHKYNHKKDRWYVLLDWVGSNNVIDAALPICEEWRKSEEMEKLIENVDQLVKSSYLSFKRQNTDK